MRTLTYWMISLALLSTGMLQANIIGVRALNMGKSMDMPERYVRVEEGYELLPFSPAQPGELIPAQHVQFLPLFERTVTEDNRFVYKVVEKIQIPAGAKGVLVLGWKGATGAQYRAIEDPFSSAKYNHWLMINAANKPIAFQIGEDNKPFLLRPNSSKTCKISAPEGEGAAVLGQAEWDGKVKTFYSTYWPIRSGERSIVIFFENGKKIALKKISDSLFKPKPKLDEQQP